MTTTSLKIVSVGVSDMDAALRLFRDLMGFQVEHDTVLPAVEDADPTFTFPEQRAVDLSVDGYPTGRVRLLATPASAPRVRDDHGGPDSPSDIGPKALDFYIVEPFEEVLDLLASVGCHPRSEPIHWRLGPFESKEVVVSGPDGVPLLFMVGVNHQPDMMRPVPAGRTFGEMATQSVLVEDVAATKAFYEQVLELHEIADVGVDPDYSDVLATLVDVRQPSGLRALVYAAPGDASGKYLLLQFNDPEGGRRLTGRMRPGHLGVALFTHDTDDLDARLVAAETHGIRASSVHVRQEPDGSFRTAFLIGPNEELIQLRERVS